jgi:hypothetical protein
MRPQAGRTMSADMAELVTLRERVDGQDAKFDSLFALMQAVVHEAGIDPDNPSMPGERRERHLHLVKGGRP